MEGKNWRLEGIYNTRIMSDTGLIAVCDVGQPDYFQNGVLIASAPQTARELDSAKARIERLEKALRFCQSVIKSGGMYDVAEQMAYKKAEAALSNIPESKLQEMSEATPDSLMSIMGDALHSEYTRPCDERP